jgi:hypothetical protein
MYTPVGALGVQSLNSPEADSGTPKESEYSGLLAIPLATPLRDWPRFSQNLAFASTLPSSVQAPLIAAEPLQNQGPLTVLRTD